MYVTNSIKVEAQQVLHFLPVPDNQTPLSSITEQEFSNLTVEDLNSQWLRNVEIKNATPTTMLMNIGLIDKAKFESLGMKHVLSKIGFMRIITDISDIYTFYDKTYAIKRTNNFIKRHRVVSQIEDFNKVDRAHNFGGRVVWDVVNQYDWVIRNEVCDTLILNNNQFKYFFSPENGGDYAANN